MNDDELIAWLRDRPDTTRSHTAALRIEALVAENAGLRAERGRVPVSWDECADWLDAGGALGTPDGYVPVGLTAAGIRKNMKRLVGLELYRLLPPPGLVAAPSGMDGGGWLGAGADVPDGWEWREWTAGNAEWLIGGASADHVVQCRPPVKPAARKVVEVPLTKLVGRVIEGCDKPSDGHPTYDDVFDNWMWRNGTAWFVIPSHKLDLDTGRVRVYAEGDES